MTDWFARYYPETPNKTIQSDMTQFINLFAKFYPCGACAEHLQGVIKTSPPAVTDQATLSQWMCETHNEVNALLHKPLFDCSLVNERWRDGWKDGSCD
eukprot:m.71776 g.71776  ORF g.71776 m.71776 type:complete len:98 (+) comp24392_c0_seq1:133-426(+)